MATINLYAATTHKSVQMAKLLSDDKGYHILAPADIAAHGRIVPFNFTTAVARPVNELIILGFLRKGMRIASMFVYHTAAGAGSLIDVGLVKVSTLDDAGISGTPILVNADFATEGVSNILPQNMLTEVTEDSYLVARIEGIPLPINAAIKGFALVFENI